MARRLIGLTALLACALAEPARAQAGVDRLDESYLKISYRLALGRCDGDLVLHHDGRYVASTRFGDLEYERSGKTDPVYWDLAVAALKQHKVKKIRSIDSYYHTVPDDDPDKEARMKALEAETDYIILDGHTFTLDWQDEKGERVYLYDATTRSLPMWKRLVQAVRLEKMTCGHHMQQMFLPQ
jgi:hypothetical protein